MPIKYFVEPELIPNDGSHEILKLLEEKISYADIFIFPDVHYKRGARIVNGILISGKNRIFPACLGVENCGFTFGKICSDQMDEKSLRDSFANFSTSLKDYGAYHDYSDQDIVERFDKYLDDDFLVNADLYRFIGLSNPDKIKAAVTKVFDKKLRKQARKTLCSLGGGNHFFEIHKICELFDKISDFQIGDYIFVLHSDSVGFGDSINLLYSNLSEWDFLKGFHAWRKRLKFRLRQIRYFMSRNLLTWETMRLLFSQKDYRAIRADSSIGKSLLFAHNVASLFGKMNRDLIIENWAKQSNLKLERFASHSHDSITVEDGRIVQRNGVQRVGNDIYFILPSAMGGVSHILKNPFNKDALLSVNHGLGRLQDKQIARENFTERETVSELKQRDISLYRVGRGNIAEQNMHAFKDADTVLQVMSRYNLGSSVATTRPIAIIKG